MINTKQKEMLLGHTRLGDPVTISLNIQEMPNYHMPFTVNELNKYIEHSPFYYKCKIW